MKIKSIRESKPTKKDIVNMKIRIKNFQKRKLEKKKVKRKS